MIFNILVTFRLKMFAKLNLQEDTKKAYISTKCNNQSYGIETRNTVIGEFDNYYQLGVEIKIRGDGNYVFDTWTVYNGHHVRNSHAIVNKTGILVGKQNMLNCFGFGWGKLDQRWMNYIIDQLEENITNNKMRWETVE